MTSLETHRSTLTRSLRATSILLAILVGALGCQRSREWNDVFHRSEGWWYSDGGGSAELPDGKTVWLFGDTWLRHNPNLLSNSLAIQDTELGEAPLKDEIRFFARGETGQLVDVTEDNRQASRSWVEPVAQGASADNTWLWPSAARVSGGKLVAMYAEVGCVTGTFPECRGYLGNMGILGYSVVEVTNPTDAPEEWHVSTTLLRDRRGQPPSTRHLHWGSALFEDSGWLYVFGMKLSDGAWFGDVKLARVLPRDIGRYDLWQFLTPRGWRMLPTGPGPSDLQTLAQGGATELSVHRIVREGRPEFVMVQVDPLEQDLVVRTTRASDIASARWAGPEEGNGVRRFSIPALDPATAGGMNWSGRAHPHHSQAGNLLVSYFSERVHSLRFLELPASELPR